MTEHLFCISLNFVFKKNVTDSTFDRDSRQEFVILFLSFMYLFSDLFVDFFSFDLVVKHFGHLRL